MSVRLMGLFWERPWKNKNPVKAIKLAQRTRSIVTGMGPMLNLKKGYPNVTPISKTKRLAVTMERFFCRAIHQANPTIPNKTMAVDMGLTVGLRK